ncbi:MAG: YdeI/OmpD-associated family protein [Thermoplasmatales archaeon]|nr:YdeI/OmpD-associated family protein [Thermoplasmatales archaeon]
MKISETLYVINRTDWRTWLEKNYDKKKEIWLIYYKKHTKKPCIPYDDAVEEALCFGWIDSTVKRIDDEKHVQRYTPRNLRSVWSPHNIKRVNKMIKQGKMTEAGLKKYEYSMEHNLQAPETDKNISVPEDFQKALENFTNLAPSYRIMYIYWIISAKKEETRKRRIDKAVKLLKESKKPWEL